MILPYKARLRFLNALTASENIALILTQVKNNSELCLIEQQIAEHSKEIGFDKRRLFMKECAELRLTEEHYTR